MFYRCSSPAPHSLNPCSASSTTKRRGGSRIFFRRGCTRLLLSSTPINYIVFFLQNTSCIRKPQVISGGRGGAHPLHPPPRSAPEAPPLLHLCSNRAPPRPCKGNWGLMVMGFCKTVRKLLVFTMGPLHLVVAVCFKWLTLCESKNLSQHTQTEVSGIIQ